MCFCVTVGKGTALSRLFSRLSPDCGQTARIRRRELRAVAGGAFFASICAAELAFPTRPSSGAINARAHWAHSVFAHGKKVERLAHPGSGWKKERPSLHRSCGSRAVQGALVASALNSEARKLQSSQDHTEPDLDSRCRAFSCLRKAIVFSRVLESAYRTASLCLPVAVAQIFSSASASRACPRV